MPLTFLPSPKGGSFLLQFDSLFPEGANVTLLPAPNVSKSIVSIGIREVSGEPGRENAAGDYIDRDPVPVRFNVVVDGRVEGCCEDLGPRTAGSLGDMGCGCHMCPVVCL